MSSGSGKKKVIAAVASSQSVKINANPDASQTKSGGIKLFIDRNRIVSVPSTTTQTTVQRPAVIDIQNVPRITPNEANLTNGTYAVSSATETVAPVKQKYVIKSFAPSTGITGKGGVEREEMRVKVTGEDRNGQSLASGGQLAQGELVQQQHSLLGRRLSTNRRLIVPSKPETDGINGQVLLPQAKTTLSDGTIKHKAITTNLNNSQPVKIISTAANISTVSIATNLNLVSVSNTQSLTASKTVNSKVAVADAGSISDLRNNQVLDPINITSVPTQIANNSTSKVSSSGQTPIEPAKEQTYSVVTTTGEASVTQVDNLKESNAETAESLVNIAQTKLCFLKSTPKDSTGINTASLGAEAGGEEVLSKPSREMKLLQSMKSNSKILTEIFTDTSNRGKLRKRHSDGAADVESINMDVSPPSIGTTKTQSPSRKRLRRQSTIYSNVMDGNSRGLATDSSYRLEDTVLKSPVGRRRKPRYSAKSEYSLQQTSLSDQQDSFAGAKDGSRDFFSSLNLGYDDTKANEQLFPANPPKPGWDRFCWRCKKSEPNIGCSKCIRSYHTYCVRYSVEDPNWRCTECKMASTVRVDVESMYKCLGYVLDIITMNPEWNESFNPIDTSTMPHYDKFITRHIDLAVMQKKLVQRVYNTPEEFLADISWIVHNMSIYTTKDKMDLQKHARAMLKKTKNEIDEMEPCQECYINANTHSERWFTEPCSKPHLLVWAKLKGYPYWPGKLYGLRGGNQAYVRFFATHDRSWMPVKDCYLYSQQDPSPSKNLKSKLMTAFTNSVKDIEHHITRLRERFNTFNYGPFMELVDPSRFEEQRRTMLPGAYQKKVKVTIKRSEGEMVAVDSSSNDEVQTLPSSNVRSEVEKSITSEQPATKVTIISPRKRMTRRMSRFIRQTEEGIEQSPTAADGSQQALNTLANNDKALECGQTTDRTTDDKIETYNESGGNPKNLSLLLRRGSQSWETLSKRRKSVIDKSMLSNMNAVSKTKSPETGSKAIETQNNINKNVPKAIIQQDAVDKPIGQKEATTLPSTGTITQSTLPCSNTKQTETSIQKDVTQLGKDVTEKDSCVPSGALVEKSPPAANNLNSPDDTCIQHEVKQVVNTSLASNSSLKNFGDSVDIHSTTTESESSGAICKTTNTTNALEDSYTTNASKTISETSIKQEIIICDEVNATEMAKDILPSFKELPQKNKSTSLEAASTVAAVSLGNTVTSVLQAPPAVLAADAAGGKTGGSNSSATVNVPSKQRARKSFPGGSFNSNRNVTSKQALSVATPVSDKAIVSIPKELVTPPSMASPIPIVESHKGNNNDALGSSASNDNDDVMIIEDESAPVTVPCRERRIVEKNQLPPPLVPKPPITFPPSSENNVDLNNSMQIFDDSSNRVLDHIRFVIEDLLKEMSGKGSSLAEVAMLKLKLEQQQQSWVQEKQKLQSEFESKIADLRITLGQEKERALNKQRLKLVGEKERAVKDAKAKQWCTKCYNEALYYCCWNTAYCSESCQQKHWMEHKNTCTQEPAYNINQPIKSSVSSTNLIVAPNNSTSLSRSHSSLNISILPMSDDSNQLNNRSLNSTVTQSDIAATSTPLQTPVRFIQNTLAGYKTPVIQSVHGRDSMIIKVSSRTAQNGGNTIGSANSSQQQQQQQQKNMTARYKSIQKAASPNKGYVPKKPYDVTSLPYQSTSLLKGTTSTIAAMGTNPSYITLSDEGAGGSIVSPGVWNHITMMPPATTNRQLHSGITISPANRRDGAEKGHGQNSPTINSNVQQMKVVQQPTSTTSFLRHQQ